MKEKIYHLITFDPYTNEVIEILNFHNLENAIARGKEFIKGRYEYDKKEHHMSLEEVYEYWEETHAYFDIYEIAESEFED